jgi:hypothetical protein
VHTDIPSSSVPGQRTSCILSLLYLFFQGAPRHLDDCRSPPLASRAQTPSRLTSKTTDQRGMMAYAGLLRDFFGKVCIYPDNTSTFVNTLAGRVLSIISTTATTRHHQRESKFPVWEHEFHRDPTEGSRPCQRAYSFCRLFNETSHGCRLKWERSSFLASDQQPLRFGGSDDYLRQNVRNLQTS